MTITRDEVLTIARLARLQLDESTTDELTRDLDQILGYVQKLNALDTARVSPTAQVTVDVAPLREDSLQAGVSKEAALEQAPRADQVGFLVPGFVDES